MVDVSGRIHVTPIHVQMPTESRTEMNIPAAVAIVITVAAEWGAGWWAVRNMPPNAPEGNTVSSGEAPTRELK